MTQPNLQINSAGITDKGLSEKRPYNEDSYLELRDSGFYAVADGVGGAQAGDVASQMAMEILGEAFINLPEGGDAEERMRLAIEQANNAIYQMSRDLAQLSTMATTVVGLHINGNVATIGHVGDSRLYRIDPQGNLFQETQDHSVVEEEVRAGRLTPEQAETHPSRNVISRALGAEETVEIDMKTIMFEPGTSFLVCSDGVTRHIRDEELPDLLGSADDTFAICQRIKDICYERGAEDNLTAVVVKAQPQSDEFVPESPDEEEETITTPRPPLVDSGVINGRDTGGISGDTREMTESDESDAKAGSPGSEPISIPAAGESSRSVSIVGENETGAASGSKRAPSVPSQDVKTFRVGQEGSSNGLSNFLTFLPWILLAGVLAIGGYYLWNNQSSTGNELQSASTDLALTAFEQNRRNVDSNPAQYIAVNSANPQDAVDYFLLGRAYFLQKNYESAKNHFERAKSLLPERVSPTNKQVLENEIAMSLAIIASEDARKAFEKELSEEAPPSNSNTITIKRSDQE